MYRSIEYDTHTLLLLLLLLTKPKAREKTTLVIFLISMDYNNESMVLSSKTNSHKTIFRGLIIFIHVYLLFFNYTKFLNFFISFCII